MVMVDLTNITLKISPLEGIAANCGCGFPFAYFKKNNLSCSWLFLYVNYGHSGSFKL
jgi:hypothetical protein